MIRTDKVKGHVVSILLSGTVKNGALVELGALESDGEAYATQAIAGTNPFVVVDAVIMDYVSNLVEPDYSSVSGEYVRGRYLEEGDIITIAQDQIASYTGVDDVVGVTVADAGWAVGGVAVGVLTARVVIEETIEGIDCAVLEITKA